MRPSSSYGTVIWTRPLHSLQNVTPKHIQLICLAVTEIITYPDQLHRFLSDLDQHLHQSQTPSTQTTPPTLIITSQVVARHLIQHIPHSTATTIQVASFGKKTISQLADHGFLIKNIHNSRSINSSFELFEALKDSHTEEYWVLQAQNPAVCANTVTNNIRTYTLYAHQPLTQDKLDQRAVKTLKALKNIKYVVSCFSSPLIYRSYRALKLPFGDHQVAIGDTTAMAMAEHGLNPAVARIPTSEDMLKTALEILSSSESL